MLRHSTSLHRLLPVLRQQSLVNLTTDAPRVGSSRPRFLSVTPRRSERAPTFTTPEEPVARQDAVNNADQHDPNAPPLKPLPPTDLPVEDYASPLLHTASFFSNLFRYAVYGSVGIVSIGVVSLVAIHAWVEQVELAGPRSAENDPEDSANWAEDVYEGWSGGHLGGGTDPRLGILARAAVRGAWISQHWGSGLAASPVTGSIFQQPIAARHGGNPSPFGATSMGGMTIGGDTRGANAVAESSRELGDAGWKMAEKYLLYAMRHAQSKGVSLDPSAASVSSPPKIDRAAIELEERLAGLRERIGGRWKLSEARSGWERIYYALASATSSAPAEEAWRQREQIRVSRKIGELSGRLALLSGKDTRERALEMSKAEGWLVGGLLPVFAGAEGRPLSSDGALSDSRITTAGASPASGSTKSASPSSSFFGFWSRSHPPTRPSSTEVVVSDASSSTPELASLVQLLSSAPPSMPAATARAVLTSLIALSSHLGARARALSSAEAVQTSALAFAQRLVDPNHSSTTALALPSSPSTGADLQKLYLATRTAVLAAHLAEVQLARALSSSSSAATTSPAPQLAALQGALNTSESVLSSLDSSSLSSAPQKKQRKMTIQAQAAAEITRDARKAGAMSANLVALTHEMGGQRLRAAEAAASSSSWGRKAAVPPEDKWCGGDAVAEVFYAKAFELAGTLDDGGGRSKGNETEMVDEQAAKAAMIGKERCRNRLLKAAAA